MDMLTQGFFTAAMVLWLLSYFGWRRVFGVAGFFDVIITIALMYAFKGSYAGLMTGVFAGVIISITLKYGAYVFGAERPRFVRKKNNLFPNLVWVRVK